MEPTFTQPKYDAFYRALVTSNVDPTGTGRIRVQCPQIAGTVEIRAAEPANPYDPVPFIGATVWLGFSGGDITKPFYLSNNAYLQLSSDSSFMQIITKTTGSLVDALGTYFVSGLGGQITGTSGPYLKIQDMLGTSAADVLVSGTVIKTNNTGTKYTWQLPGYTTGWSGNTTFNGLGGYQQLQFRLDANDNLLIYGGFISSSSGATNPVAMLPPLYRPLDGSIPVSVQSYNGTIVKMGHAYISTSGNINLFSASGVPVENSTQYLIWGHVPLGTIS